MFDEGSLMSCLLSLFTCLGSFLFNCGPLWTASCILACFTPEIILVTTSHISVSVQVQTLFKGVAQVFRYGKVAPGCAHVSKVWDKVSDSQNILDTKTTKYRWQIELFSSRQRLSQKNHWALWIKQNSGYLLYSVLMYSLFTMFLNGHIVS